MPSLRQGRTCSGLEVLPNAHEVTALADGFSLDGPARGVSRPRDASDDRHLRGRSGRRHAPPLRRVLPATRPPLGVTPRTRTASPPLELIPEPRMHSSLPSRHFRFRAHPRTSMTAPVATAASRDRTGQRHIAARRTAGTEPPGGAAGRDEVRNTGQGERTIVTRPARQGAAAARSLGPRPERHTSRGFSAGPRLSRPPNLRVASTARVARKGSGVDPARRHGGA